MCGRYVTVTKLKAIEKRFNLTTPQPNLFKKSVNVSHGVYAPVVAFWAKKKMYVINARSEGDHNKENDPKYTGAMGIIKKPMFRHAIRRKRCLVVVDAFLEGPKKERLSKPHLVYMRDGKRPFALAGIWDEWTDKDTGEIIQSFAIITTVPNKVTEAIGHHRSPVVLKEEDEQRWLDPELPLADATALLKPYDGTLMNAYPIDPAIKSPRAEGLDLLKPVGQRVIKEYDYELYDELRLEGMGESRARQRKNAEDED